jgi:glycerol uptake facilitator-like aquaporin
MAEFLGSFILELCIVTPGAFILALLKGSPRSTGQVMNSRYALSLAFGVVIWALVIAGIKFGIYGCIVCN